MPPQRNGQAQRYVPFVRGQALIIIITTSRPFRDPGRFPRGTRWEYYVLRLAMYNITTSRVKYRKTTSVLSFVYREFINIIIMQCNLCLLETRVRCPCAARAILYRYLLCVRQCCCT